ncbi:hypothetical protein Enr13x_62910 [Stieleria neptunia]|uniref:Uncharacterized protein n=1 Tax=Stieleria neptunia TaxID=2527979 RepID=A0A518HZU7_9BACT|nr:hypothetical protein Enr13x_62910 [Stieleria neptunia]
MSTSSMLPACAFLETLGVASKVRTPLDPQRFQHWRTRSARMSIPEGYQRVAGGQRSDTSGKRVPQSPRPRTGSQRIHPPAAVRQSAFVKDLIGELECAGWPGTRAPTSFASTPFGGASDGGPDVRRCRFAHLRLLAWTPSGSCRTLWRRRWWRNGASLLGPAEGAQTQTRGLDRVLAVTQKKRSRFTAPLFAGFNLGPIDPDRAFAGWISRRSGTVGLRRFPGHPSGRLLGTACCRFRRLRLPLRRVLALRPSPLV